MLLSSPPPNFRNTFAILLLYSIFNLPHSIFFPLCFSMTGEILSLAGRIAHFENGRWGGVSHTEKYILVFPIPQSPSYPEVGKKKKKSKEHSLHDCPKFFGNFRLTDQCEHSSYWAGQKVHLGFSVTSYGQTQENFLANPIIYDQNEPQ